MYYIQMPGSFGLNPDKTTITFFLSKNMHRISLQKGEIVFRVLRILGTDSGGGARLYLYKTRRKCGNLI